jgi:hypothetical protein
MNASWIASVNPALPPVMVLIFMLLVLVLVECRGIEPRLVELGDLPRFVLCDNCLVGSANSVSKSESQIMAKVSVKGCKELAEFCDCLRCHVGIGVGCC